MRRRPAVAGHFYPAQPEALRREIDAYLQSAGQREKPIACVVPHAGIMYSGHVAGAVYARLEPPARVIVLGPNHRGFGAPLAINAEGAWETPLGDAPIDAELARALRRACPALTEDAEAHRYEHSLEVQLPFLERCAPGFRLVPIAVGTGRYEQLEELGHALAQVVKAQAERPLLIASTDLNHYEPDEVSRRKDALAIDEIRALNPRGLFDVIRREKISMCGYGPTVAVLTAAKDLGAKEAELVRYANSGDITGDRSAVVGYAGLIIR